MEAILAAVQPYEIHGTRYYRIAYSRKDQPDRVVEGRVAIESIYKDPQPGDLVDIQMLLGVINDVKKLSDSASRRNNDVPATVEERSEQSAQDAWANEGGTSPEQGRR